VRSLLAEQPESNNDDHHNDTFTQRLIAKALHNVQVIVRHLHLRYEDHTDPIRPIAFGVSLREFSAHTTDDKWEVKFVPVR
jgi:hypothetical protein